jgi:hypothetical protein
MTVEIYNHIVCDLDYEISSQFQSVHSQFDSKVQQTHRVFRFPTHVISPIKYPFLNQTDRDTLFQFWRSKYGDSTRFWFFDFLQRKMVR